jgi:flagellar biosynthesis protein FlhG
VGLARLLGQSDGAPWNAAAITGAIVMAVAMTALLGLRETYGVEQVVARIYDPRRAEVYQRLGIPTVATVSWTTEQIMRRLLPLGARAEYNLGHFLAGQKTLEEITLKTRQGIQLIPGASGMQELAALSHIQAASIVQAFSNLGKSVDYLIVDVAAGISPSVLAFLSACHRRFVVVQDDPSSIADAYGTIKVMSQEMQLDEIYLIPNLVDTQTQGWKLYQRLNDVCMRFLNESIHYLTAIERDEMVLAALKKYQSVMELAPGTAAARDFRRLAELCTQLRPIDHPSGGLQFFMERLLKSSANQ